MASSNRRNFLKTSGLGLAGTAALSYTRAFAGGGANNRFQVGIIGPGGMGNHHIRQLLTRKDVLITHVCDADANRAATAAKAVEKGAGQAPQVSQDLRTVLNAKAVDAVFIATPDHWHAPAAVLACAAGKHVYVEKPCSHNIGEGRLMVEAARRHKEVMQVGTQSRSSEHVVRAMEILHKGEIG